MGALGRDNTGAPALAQWGGSAAPNWNLGTT